MAVKDAVRVLYAGVLLVPLVVPGQTCYARNTVRQFVGDDAPVADGQASMPHPATRQGQQPAVDPAYTQAPMPDDSSAGQPTGQYPGQPMAEDGQPNGCDECDPCTGCGGGRCFGMFGGGRYWVHAEYLQWWTSGAYLPVLVTTGGDGTLGNSIVAFGGGRENWLSRPGWRITGGRWLGDGQSWGIEGDYYELGSGSTLYSNTSTSTGNPLIARPFFDVNPAFGTPAAQSASMVSEPGNMRGAISVLVTDYFQSAGARFRHPLWQAGGGCNGGYDGCGGTSNWQLDMLVGYRYYLLADQVKIDQISAGLPTSTTPGIIGLTTEVQDIFRTANVFNGGEVGFTTLRSRDRWSIGFNGKLALGNNRQTVDIKGSTSRTSGVATGGLLAQSTNIGVHTRDQFTVIPEIGVEAGFMITCNLRAVFGYDLVYWSSVVRAGDQIDTNIDSARIPSQSRTDILQQSPSFSYRTTDYWAQGFHAGLDLRF